MSKIIRDRFGERDKAGQNDSSDDEKEMRRMLNRALERFSTSCTLC